MAFTPINSTEIEVGKPVKKGLWQKVKDNFTDLDSRINALVAGTYKINVFQYNNSEIGIQNIGQVVASDLDPTAFAKQNGTGWLKCNGQSASGTLWATITGQSNVPDLRGQFIRGLDESRGLDKQPSRAIRSTQTQDTQEHGHTAKTLTPYSAGWDYSAANPIATDIAGIVLPDPLGGTTHETRPTNLALYYYMKVNSSARTQLAFFVAKQNMALTDIKIYTSWRDGITPTGGTLEIDIRKGSTATNPNSWTTIFLTKPAVSDLSGNFKSNPTLSISPGAEVLLAGEALVLDITSLPVGLVGVFVDATGEPS